MCVCLFTWPENTSKTFRRQRNPIWEEGRKRKRRDGGKKDMRGGYTSHTT